MQRHAARPGVRERAAGQPAQRRLRVDAPAARRPPSAGVTTRATQASAKTSPNSPSSAASAARRRWARSGPASAPGAHAGSSRAAVAPSRSASGIPPAQRAIAAARESSPSPWRSSSSWAARGASGRERELAHDCLPAALEPAGLGRVAAGDDDRGAGRQRRQQRRAQVAAERAHALVGVDHDERALGAPGARQRLLDGVGHGRQVARVERERRVAGARAAAGDLAQQDALADPARSVDEQDAAGREQRVGDRAARGGGRRTRRSRDRRCGRRAWSSPSQSAQRRA